MKYILIEILQGHLVIAVVVLISYVIELLTPIKLLIWMFKMPKNDDMAQGAANFHAFLYFIVCLGTLLYDRYTLDVLPPGYSFWKWLIIIVPLTVIFRMVYYKLTSIDPGRDDQDFSMEIKNK